MTDRELLWLGIGGAALLLGGGAAIALSGPRVSSSTTDDDGQIAESPDELLAQAIATMGRPVSMDAYALARMAQSEGSAAARPRMLVALNDGAAEGWDALTTVTFSTAPGRTGTFGPQFVRSPRVVRRYATTKDPARAIVELAEQVIADWSAGNDETGGAVKFADRSSFGVQEGTGSFDDTVAAWAKERLTPSNVPGYSSDFFVFRRA